jgi:hypothetical protein
MQISIGVIFHIGAFIVYQLLKQTGFLQWVYEIIYTHPSFNKSVRILGAVTEGISISVVGAGVYQFFLDGKIIYSAIFFGIIWIIIGSVLKEYKR